MTLAWPAQGAIAVPLDERLPAARDGLELHAIIADTRGFVVFDRFVCDRACGGLRVLPGVTVEEVAGLAASMTRKFAFLGIGCGGAKAGVVEQPGWSEDERGRALEAFGAALAPYLRTGLYVLGEDMGCRPADLRRVRYGAGLVPTRGGRDGSEHGSGYWAGLTTAVAAAVVLERAGCRVAGARVAIEGFGRVGRSAALELARRGARLQAVSNVHGAIVGDDLPPRALIEFLRDQGEDAITRFPGARPLPRAQLFAEDVDLIVPCARPAAIHAANVAGLRCRAIVPGGNTSVAAGLEGALHARGILVLPGFVANLGGVLVGHLTPLAPRPTTTAWLAQEWFADLVRRLLRAAAAEKLTPTAVARRRAQRNLDRLAALRRRPAYERLLDLLGRSRLRRMLPARLERALVARIFRDAL